MSNEHILVLLLDDTTPADLEGASVLVLDAPNLEILEAGTPLSDVAYDHRFSLTSPGDLRALADRIEAIRRPQDAGIHTVTILQDDGREVTFEYATLEKGEIAFDFHATNAPVGTRGVSLHGPDGALIASVML
jgi:hypothetical protein